MKRELEQIEIPNEHEARVRSLAVVREAFAEREPQPRRRSWKPLAAIAIALVVVAGLLSPPGRAVLDDIRGVVGVEKAQPALFSLPTRGRLLVTADSGAWVVEEDGSKRLLGSYREASWSPFGRFVVVSRRNELAALTPEGDPHWSLARRDVRFPRWGGTRTDTRIAYFSQGQLRVVGGDGKGDRLLDNQAALNAPSWKPGSGHRARVRKAGRDGPRRRRGQRRGARSRRPGEPTRGVTQRVRKLLGDGGFADRCDRPTAAGSRWAGPARTSSSSCTWSAGSRSAPSRTCRASSARGRSRRSAAGAARPDRPVDSRRVLVRQRQGSRAGRAARGRPRPAALLPLRLVTDMNAGAASPRADRRRRVSIAGVRVFGVSRDSHWSHRAWKQIARSTSRLVTSRGCRTGTARSRSSSAPHASGGG